MYTMKQRMCLLFLITIMGGLFIVNPVFAKAKKFEVADASNYDFGIAAGILFSGEISAEDFGVDVTTDSAPMVRVIMDTYVAPAFAVGGYINFSPVNFSEINEDATMFEFGVAFKPRIVLSPTVALKPGFNVGYRKIISDSEYVDCEGLGLNFSLEIQFLRESGDIFYIDTGFLTQPIGGKHDYSDITFGPIFYLLGGIAF